MKRELNVLCSTEILVYANAKNYPGVQEGDCLKLVDEDAALMDADHRKRYGTTIIVDRKIGEDIIGTLVTSGRVFMVDNPSLSDTYFNR